MTGYCHSCGHFTELQSWYCGPCSDSYAEQYAARYRNDLPEVWQESDANPEG
jgi:hypothetical protein